MKIVCHQCYRYVDLVSHHCADIQQYLGDNPVFKELMLVTKYLRMRDDEFRYGYNICLDYDRYDKLDRVYLTSTSSINQQLKNIESKRFNVTQDYYLQQAYSAMLEYYYEPGGIGMQKAAAHFRDLVEKGT